MKPLSSVSILLLLCSLFDVALGRKTTNPSKVPKNAVLLSKINSLTFRQGRLTSSRRVDPVPQLVCTGPEDVCKLYNVDTMRCKNEGADYDPDNIQWSCKASLPDEFKLGSTDVICEGYESSDDPYVLKGSCGVEYRLLLTEAGAQKYGQYLTRQETQSRHDGWYASIPTAVGQKGSNRAASILFGIIFIGVLFIILKGFISSIGGRPPRRGGNSRGHGGGDDDPPPPYDGPPAYSPRPKKQSKTSASSSRTNTSQARSQQEQNAWRPGFWTGAAAGAAAAGYAANRVQQNRSRSQQQQQTQMQERASSWINPSTGGSRPSFGSSSVPDPSTSRHESTGFGETRRR